MNININILFTRLSYWDLADYNAKYHHFVYQV